MNAKASGKTKRTWLAFDRADYIGTKIILGIAVVAALFGLGVPVFNAVTDAPLPVSYATIVTSGIELPRGATGDAEARVQVVLNDSTIGERFGQELPGLMSAGVGVAVVWLLFQLLRSTQTGEPFSSRNVWRINMIALMVGIGGVVIQIAQAFADNAIHTTGRLPSQSSSTFTMSFTPLPLIVMLVIALVGEAFRRGVELRDDVEGLV